MRRVDKEINGSICNPSQHEHLIAVWEEPQIPKCQILPLQILQSTTLIDDGMRAECQGRSVEKTQHKRHLFSPLVLQFLKLRDMAQFQQSYVTGEPASYSTKPFYKNSLSPLLAFVFYPWFHVACNGKSNAKCYAPRRIAYVQ